MEESQLSLVSENIVCHTVRIGEGVTGFVYQSKRGRYHIFISEDLSPKAQKMVFLHELYHILNDLPNMGYIIGIDMQREEFELKADEFSRQIERITSILA